MAAAADFHLQAGVLGAKNGSLDMGFSGGGDNDEGFGCGRCIEPFVSDVRLKNCSVGRIGLGVNY